MNFIARQIVTCALPQKDMVLKNLYRYISSEVDIDESWREHWEREQAWLELLRAKCFSDIPVAEMIELSKQTKCNRVTELLLIEQKRYDEVLKTYIYDSERHVELIHYLYRYVKDPERLIYKQVSNHFEELLKINSAAITKFILQNYRLEICSFIEKLPKSYELYVFFKCLTNENICLESTHTEMYIEMTLEYSPEEVVDYLRSSFIYDTNRVIKICQYYDNKKALSYLYEKNNDFNSALEVELDLFDLQACEESFENITSLCCRHNGSYPDREKLWFRWLGVLFSKRHLVSLFKSVLNRASSCIELSNLVQFVINFSTTDKSFCLIRDIIVLLSNAKHECMMFKNANGIFVKDLQIQNEVERNISTRGTLIRSVKCVLCRMRLDRHKSDVLIIGSCGHALHSHCRNIQSHLFGRLECPRCGNFTCQKSELTL